jgi:fatty-acyl-CoA synthase
MSFPGFLNSTYQCESVLSLRLKNSVSTVSGPEFLKRIEECCPPLRDFKKHSIILICLEHSLDLVASFFACLSLDLVPGYIAHPSNKVDYEDYNHKLQTLVDCHKPSCIVVEPQFSKRFAEAFPGIEIIILDQANIERLELSPPESPSFLQFSSGSTGIPKAMSYTWSNLQTHVQDFEASLKLQVNDSFISWLPLYHDMGLIASLMTPLITHHPLHLMSPFDWIKNPGILFEDGAFLQSSHCWMPNFAFKLLSKKLSPKDYDLSSFRCIASCAEPILYQTMQEFYDLFKEAGLSSTALAGTYAMAESVFAMTHKAYNLEDQSWFMQVCEKAFETGKVQRQAEGSRYLVSCGRPLKNLELRVNAKTGEIGEILIRSQTILQKYLNQDVSILDAEGWFNTGDRGVLLEGELYICGRSSDLIIHHGVNLYPQDVEDVLNGIEGVYAGRNVCLGLKNETTGTEEVIILTETMGEVHPDELVETIYDKTARSLDIIPSKIRVVPYGWLRKTSSGKISRRLNLQKFLDYENKPIHIIGCSHIYAFNASEELYNQKTTAQNIHLKQIPIVSSENITREPRASEFRNYLAELPKEAAVFLLFGEQDIRTVIPFLLRQKNLSLEEALEQIYQSYKAMLREIHQLRPDLILAWIIPPPPGTGMKPHPRFMASKVLTDEVYYHFLATQEERRIYAKAFEKLLQDKLSVPLINIWPKILKNEASLEVQEHFLRDDSHLQNVKSIYEEEIHQQLGLQVLATKETPQDKTRTRLNPTNIDGKLKPLLRKHFGIRAKPSTPLLSRLSSLDIVELLSLLQEHFEVSLPPTWMDKSEIATYQDLRHWVLKFTRT